MQDASLQLISGSFKEPSGGQLYLQIGSLGSWALTEASCFLRLASALTPVLKASAFGEGVRGRG